eukprot:scaffold276_cov548-Prasinococcus_capsulatus_cf.AAC.21
MAAMRQRGAGTRSFPARTYGHLQWDIPVLQIAKAAVLNHISLPLVVVPPHLVAEGATPAVA